MVVYSTASYNTVDIILLGSRYKIESIHHDAKIYIITDTLL